MMISRRAAILLIALMLVSAYIVGVKRGLDHRLIMGLTLDPWHLAVAISDNVYGLHHGYVGFAKVFTSLETSMGVANGVNPNDSSLIPRAGDETIINGALKKAATLDGLRDVGVLFPPTIETFARLNLMAPIAEDLGESKLYSIAFQLFGLRIQSAYYLFYVIFSFSVAAFILQFRRSPIALAALLLNVLAFHVFFYIRFFDPGIPTVYSNRFVSTLCIVPVLHVLFLLFERRPANKWSVGLAALQVAVLTFGLFVRSSGNWGVLAIVFVGIVQVVAAALRVKRGNLAVRLGWASRKVSLWPVALVICGVILLQWYLATAPHPLYRQGDNPPHHMAWHSAWLGLAVHPDFKEYFPQLPSLSDGTGWEMTRSHLRAVGLEDQFYSKITGYPSAGIHEAYIREQFLKFAREHPWYMLQLELYYKPRLFIEQMAWGFEGSTLNYKIVLPILAALFVALGLAATRGRESAGAPLAKVSHALAASIVLFGFSCLPIMFAYPALHSMADEVWTSILLIATVAWVGLLLVVERTRSGLNRAPGVVKDNVAGFIS